MDKLSKIGIDFSILSAVFRLAVGWMTCPRQNIRRFPFLGKIAAYKFK
jgi:hypothetical protein